jgi:hypothetical protein
MVTAAALALVVVGASPAAAAPAEPAATLPGGGPAAFQQGTCTQLVSAPGVSGGQVAVIVSLTCNFPVRRLDLRAALEKNFSVIASTEETASRDNVPANSPLVLSPHIECNAVGVYNGLAVGRITETNGIVGIIGPTRGPLSALLCA